MQTLTSVETVQRISVIRCGTTNFQTTLRHRVNVSRLYPPFDKLLANSGISREDTLGTSRNKVIFVKVSPTSTGEYRYNQHFPKMK